ncbi:uncharacterized protein FA14DRAFT_179723 [Meira miltonrushii]|uniref:Uncharacterized protein n=1 Tax=Meira miltonrushii TaxID=1280837 RepID=A0A316VLF0_9BASI|nr:uncharacterized protein FA14DRAFT_179723 [Meira miltonrushii]PWN36365.1 hypothetical protein FA14DRAFT_179723 [Meira miltonrushii]
MLPDMILLLTSLLVSLFAGLASAYPFQKSVCEGKERYEQCLPIPLEQDDSTWKPRVLDMIFPFAMRVTPGSWEEGGTIYASMCMFQNANPDKCYTVTTDQHDVNLMHRQAGYGDVLWENALLVPCQIPDQSRKATWYLKVTDHANYGLNHHWVNTTK